MKTLEELLQEYFGCEKPFIGSPDCENEEECEIAFTEEGLEAYDKLIQLVYDIHALVGSQEANKMVDVIDSITREMQKGNGNYEH